MSQIDSKQPVRLWHRGVTGVAQSDKVFFVENDVKIPMRDGVLLSCDIHLPNDVGEKALPAYAEFLKEFVSVDLDGGDIQFDSKVPCVLIRTPYNKGKVHPDMRHPALYWVQNGYACVIQDCRGRFQSEGSFFKYVNEAEDGFDTVEWLAQQPWCNGDVFSFGVSYLAHTQTSMACLAPPHLKAMFVVKGGFYDAITSGIRQGGAFEARQWLWAIKNVSGSHKATTKRGAYSQSAVAAWMAQYPFQPGNSPLSKSKDSDYEKYAFEFATKSCLTSFWRRPGLSVVQHLDEIKTPALFLSGWYDIYSRSSVELYNAFRRSVGSAKAQLILGPWVHTGQESHYAGEVDFGIQATLENSVANSRYELARSWFDRFVTAYPGMPSRLPSNITTPLPPVLYYRMGGGEGHKTAQKMMFHGGLWLAAESFPPPNTAEQLYLLENGGRLRVPNANRAQTVVAVAKRRKGPIAARTVVEWARKHTQTAKEKTHATTKSIPTTTSTTATTNTNTTPTSNLITVLSNGEIVPASLCSRFLFDPRQPFPCIGGNITPYPKLCMPGAYNQVHRNDHAFCTNPKLVGLPLSSRQDVLVFKTRVLKESLDVTGTPRVTLFVSSSCVDTDFYAMLIDEYPQSDDYPQGFQMNISHGIVRCSQRNVVPVSTAPGQPEFDFDENKTGDLLQPENVYCVDISMYPTSNLFEKGHRIAVYITSSAYPHFDVNPNTGSPACGGGSKITRVAENTVWHSHALPSHIVLPVVSQSPCAPPQFVPLSDLADDNDDDNNDDDDDDDDEYDSPSNDSTAK